MAIIGGIPHFQTYPDDQHVISPGAGFSADSGLAVYDDVAKVRPVQLPNPRDSRFGTEGR